MVIRVASKFVTIDCASILIFVLHVSQSIHLHEMLVSQIGHSILMYLSFYFSIFTEPCRGTPLRPDIIGCRRSLPGEAGSFKGGAEP
jgi:hypothetical protein